MSRLALIIIATCIGLSSPNASAQPQTTATPSPSSSLPPARMRIAGLVLIGIGAGAFATGAVLLGVGVSQNTDAMCVGTPGVVGCGSRSINGEMIAGWSAMGLGLIALGVGVPLFVIGRHRLHQARAALQLDGSQMAFRW